MARVRWVGVDTQGVYRASMKRPAVRLALARPKRAAIELQLAARRPGGAGKVLGDATELAAAAGFHPVRQDHFRHLVDLRDPDFGYATVGSQRLGRLAPDQVGPMPVHLEADVELGERAKDPGRHDDMREANDRLGDPRPNLGILLGEPLAEFGRVRFPFLPPLDDLDPLPDVLDAFDIDRQTESVEQLRAEVAFFRVHRPDQDEACRMPDRNTFALHHVYTHGCGIQQHIDQVVVEQVDLVDVQDVAVCLGQDARLEAALAALDCGLDVDRPDDPVLRGVDRQLDDTHAASGAWQYLAAGQPVLAIRAERLGRVRVAAVEAVRDDVEFREQAGEGSHGR